MGTCVAEPYAPATTVVLPKLIIPEVVMGPPVRPVPVDIFVTVPVPAVPSSITDQAVPLQ